MADSIASETVFSFVSEVPAPAGADAAGSPAVLDTCTTIRGSIRNACFIRRLTGAGAIIHADFEPEAGESIQLELESGQRLEGVVEWQSGFEAGLRFERPVDVFAIIARNLVSMPGERRRMPRIEMRCAAHIEAPCGTELAVSRDVSHGGVKLETALALSPGDPVRITMDGLFPLDGVVRWAKDGLAGIAFTPEPGWQELMPWLKEMRELAARSAATEPRQTPASERHPAMARLDRAQGDVHLNIPARIRDGTRRWNIQVKELSTRAVKFEAFSPIRLGTFLWVVLPGLEGWPGRIVKIEGNRFTCAFTQPLQPCVLERILAAAGKQ